MNPSHDTNANHKGETMTVATGPGPEITDHDATRCRCGHRQLEHEALGALRPCRKLDCFCRRFREPEPDPGAAA